MEQSAALDMLTRHYSEQFTISYDVGIAGITVPVAASLRHRGQVSILGFGTGRLGPEACEHVFILKSESFNADLFEKITKLVIQAEQECVKPGKDHAYTFLSVAALVSGVDKSAAELLKKYKYRRDYAGRDWVMSRVAVLNENGECFCSKDGSDFKKLILSILKKGEK